MVSDGSADATPRIVAEVRCDVGENPLYHPDEHLVYWCDIPNGDLYAYDPEGDTHERVYGDPDERIGGFTIQTDGSLLLFQEAGAVRRYADGEVETVVAADPDEFHERFNDVIADPEGRVYCGVMPDEDAGADGAMYRLDRDGSFTLVEPSVGLPNGFGFTPDRERLYFTDTCELDDRPGHIYLYDYDRGSGELSNREVFVEADGIEGLPDGMTVDEDGHVWSAFWDGHKLIRFSPDGERERTIRFDPRKVSCPTFGGPDYETAYVTTAGGTDRAREGDGAGSLYEVDLGVGGVPEFRSAIDVS
jgi:D-xylonolactonase